MHSLELLDAYRSGPDVLASFVDDNELMGPSTAYVCPECLTVSADPDTESSARMIVRHVIHEHPGSLHLTSHSVKVLVLSRDEADVDCISGTPTYRQAITGEEHAHGRRELFVCFFCRLLFNCVNFFTAIIIISGFGI